MNGRIDKISNEEIISLFNLLIDEEIDYSGIIENDGNNKSLDSDKEKIIDIVLEKKGDLSNKLNKFIKKYNYKIIEEKIDEIIKKRKRNN